MKMLIDANKVIGFTLIELVAAIVVLSVTVAMFSSGMRTLSERSVLPIIGLQASAVARSYLDEIKLVYKQGMPWCEEKDVKHARIISDRRSMQSLCEYIAVKPSPVTTVSGKSYSHLRDFRIKMSASPVTSARLASVGDSNYPDLPGVKVTAIVTHPGMAPIELETWLWDRKP